MKFFYWEKLIAAFLTAGIVILYCATTDNAQKAIRRFLQTWVVRLIQLWLLGQGVYVVLSFFQISGAPSRGEIGFLLLAIFNALIWGFFLGRDTVRYVLDSRQRQESAP